MNACAHTRAPRAGYVNAFAQPSCTRTHKSIPHTVNVHANTNTRTYTRVRTHLHAARTGHVSSVSIHARMHTHARMLTRVRTLTHTIRNRYVHACHLIRTHTRVRTRTQCKGSLMFTYAHIRHAYAYTRISVFRAHFRPYPAP